MIISFFISRQYTVFQGWKTASDDTFVQLNKYSLHLWHQNEVEDEPPPQLGAVGDTVLLKGDTVLFYGDTAAFAYSATTHFQPLIRFFSFNRQPIR